MFELNIQKNWIDALYARSSVRQYTSAPDKAQLDKLGETCRKLSWQGVKIRMFKGPGLKSQIKGTDAYAVIIAKRGTPMEVEGFMGEALVLEATAMGLGTCWLGAGFYPDIISSDLVRVSEYTRPGFSLLYAMSVNSAAGMPTEKILQSVTYTPAKSLGIEEKAGVIREGAPADVAILDIRDVKDKTFTDNYGNSISGNKLFVPLMTVKGGRTAYRQIFF